MRVQVVSKYLALAEEGLVSRLDCPIDQGLLVPNIDENDNVFLYCLSCNYKNNMGLEVYDNIRKQVERYTK